VETSLTLVRPADCRHYLHGRRRWSGGLAKGINDGRASGDFLTMDANAVGLGILPLLIGVPLVWYFGSQCWTGLRSRRWPTVPGRITQYFRTIDPGSAQSSHGISAKLAIEYDYTVNGRSYKGKRIAATYAKLGPDQWEPSTSVDVFYDPSNPERALLVPGVQKLSLQALGIGLILTTLGVLILLLGFR
jgi:hypothetical protein